MKNHTYCDFISTYYYVRLSIDHYCERISSYSWMGWQRSFFIIISELKKMSREQKIAIFCRIMPNCCNIITLVCSETAVVMLRCCLRGLSIWNFLSVSVTKFFTMEGVNESLFIVEYAKINVWKFKMSCDIVSKNLRCATSYDLEQGFSTLPARQNCWQENF